MILIEHGPGGEPSLFDQPREVITAWRPGEVRAALARADAARAAGAWLAGYVAYEAGYALEPRLSSLMPRKRPGPLVALGVYEAPRPAGQALERAAKEGRSTWMTAPEPLVG
ncbi:MAG: aminodeoxychorismate synthase component I, partial [Tabrizicola sp.]